MSMAARELLVNQLRFEEASQRSDLLNPSLTDSNLIALLLDLVQRCSTPILITAVRTDHPTFDGGPNGHGHNAGKAVDFWVASADADIVKAIVAISHNPYAWTVGLGGAAKEFQSYTTWPNNGEGPFVLFADNDTDHIHVQCANMYGEGQRA